MLPKGVTLRGLEVFEALASTGSVAKASARTGLSQPAVSQQLRNLETALGVELIDHGKRPMRLTPTGDAFLVRAEAALSQLRQGRAELTVMDLAHLSSLSLGLIDDFDNDLTPKLATTLANSLKGCRFKLITAASHEITAAVRAQELHIGVAAADGAPSAGVLEYPLARDPFILVMPRGETPPEGRLPDGSGPLPFLRYERKQLISRQIEAHLARRKISYEERFEVGSHLALMAMVAHGIGWAITTPLGYMRAVRFHDQVAAHPLPPPGFARTITLYAGADWAGTVPADIAHRMRDLITTQMIGPALVSLPWLEGELRVLDG